jgi:hypothetical protein
MPVSGRIMLGVAGHHPLSMAAAKLAHQWIAAHATIRMISRIR